MPYELPEPKTPIGEMIVAHLKDARIGVNEMCRRVGVANGFISRIISGERTDLKVDTVLLLAKEVGATVEEMMAGRRNPEAGAMPPQVAGLVEGASDEVRCAAHAAFVLYSDEPMREAIRDVVSDVKPWDRWLLLSDMVQKRHEIVTRRGRPVREPAVNGPQTVEGLMKRAADKVGPPTTSPTPARSGQKEPPPKNRPARANPKRR